jgi:hypothetical protein
MEDARVAYLTTFFGSSLIPVLSSSLDHFALPEDTKQFLQSFGLPLEPGLSMHLYADAEVHSIQAYGPQRFLIIGDDSGTELGMREGTGEILSLDPRGKLPTRFVNSHILALLSFFAVSTKAQSELIGASDAKAFEMVASMREAFRREDSRSLDDPETWWSVILEQIEHGML